MTQAPAGNARHAEVRKRAFEDLKRFEVVMDGHFDYGNGFHGNLYLNPHQLFQFPSTIWRVAQDLIDVMPAEFIEQTEIVAGPATGGALLAHTIAGLLDGRRAMTHPPFLFAPFGDVEGTPSLSPFYALRMKGKRVLIVDDVRNTGTTFKRCADLVSAAGGRAQRAGTRGVPITSF
ncbi:MAG TPA: phosphoribosyltransferase family protein [Vicinamibacterales bacterium]|nr:phosphoribosyltransferase family protein [Vicinamibacterales bacterium]